MRYLERRTDRGERNQVHGMTISVPLYGSNIQTFTLAAILPGLFGHKKRGLHN
jgi:hypothetical protein